MHAREIARAGLYCANCILTFSLFGARDDAQVTETRGSSMSGASIATPAKLPTCPVAHALGFTSAGGRGGNAAGVVFPADHAALSDVQRIAVAARLGFSETVFITSIRPAANASTCDVATGRGSRGV